MRSGRYRPGSRAVVAGLCLAVLLTGCAGEAVFDELTPARVLGYPLPKGETVSFDADDDNAPPDTQLVLGDLVELDRWLEQSESDTDRLVLAEITTGHLIYQAVRTGEDRLQTTPIPPVVGDHEGMGRIPPEVVKLTIVDD
jgi:hypothetical protein